MKALSILADCAVILTWVFILIQQRQLHRAKLSSDRWTAFITGFGIFFIVAESGLIVLAATS